MKDNLSYLILVRFVTYAGIFIVSVIMIGNHRTVITLFSLLFALIVVNGLMRMRRLSCKPAWFVASVLLEILIVSYMQNTFNSIVFADLYIVTVDVYITLELNYAIFVSIAIYAGLMAAAWPESINIHDLQSLFIDAALNLTLMLFFAAATHVVRLERNKRIEIQYLNAELYDSRNKLEETNRKLQAYAKKVEDITVTSERNRLAGEIHDELGHNLTALILEIGICDRLVDHDLDKTRIELRKAHELAKNALSDVRRYVGSIKPSNIEGLTGVRALEELANAFQETARVMVKLTVSEQQYRLSPSVDVTIYNIVQEALTNCARHGRADSVLIDLRFKEHAVELLIKDNGRGCRQLVKSVGLKTMEERIAALGGKVDFSGNDGFAICAAIPVGGF